MLSDDTNENDDITIQEFDGDIRQALILYCYTGNIWIHDQNVKKILVANSLMKFIGIEKMCEAFCVDFLLRKNCLGYRCSGW